MFSNWLTASASVASSIPTVASAPDVILEIGPMPMTRQFVAHSPVLMAHSGYFRSIVRPDERVSDCPIFVPNITAEHFAPLLTYMYTGYLDLNIENIFGVLLATHVLHMPRALEICRNYLARIQSEGYATGSAGPFDKIASMQTHESVRVVRPIASKAPTSGLSFIAAPVPKTIAYSHDTPFKSFNLPVSSSSGSVSDKSETNIEVDGQSDDCKRESPTPSTPQLVDVDRVTPDESVHLNIAPKPERFSKKSKGSGSTVTKSVEKFVAQAAANTKMDGEEDKFVIDVACCDGPVRFQRVLNEAYNRSPLKQTSDANSASEPHELAAHTESQRVQVATAFHIQMAKNISERQAHRLDTGGDSENDNAPDRSGRKTKKMKIAHGMEAATVTTVKNEEIFTCVYCKHTFKSQYCYQKHAKRHLNPLSLDGNVIDGDRDEKCENSSTVANTNTATPVTSVPAGRTACAKREVRPLDMNVQYYPCKTCGSKFPSYYFVHKHRKLCHSNEEN